MSLIIIWLMDYAVYRRYQRYQLYCGGKLFGNRHQIFQYKFNTPHVHLSI